MGGLTQACRELKECLNRKVSKTWLLLAAFSVLAFLAGTLGGPIAWTVQEIHRIDIAHVVANKRMDELAQTHREISKQIQDRHEQIIQEIRALKK